MTRLLFLLLLASPLQAMVTTRWTRRTASRSSRFRRCRTEPSPRCRGSPRYPAAVWRCSPPKASSLASATRRAGRRREGAAFVAAEGWTLANNRVLALGADDTVFFAAGAFWADDDAKRAAIAVTRLATSGGHRPDVAVGTAAIYHNGDRDHYFLTANPAEQALLDSGATAGWRRSTDDFRVVTGTPPDASLTPICRFYGRPEANLDSHFFSAAPDECAAVAVKFAANWILETDAVFYVHPADRTTGHCPRGSQRVHRAFDNRADVNHWYGILPVKPSGWIYEGYGPAPFPTAFCAPLL